MADGDQAPRGDAHDERKIPITGLTDADGRLEPAKDPRSTASSAPRKGSGAAFDKPIPPSHHLQHTVMVIMAILLTGVSSGVIGGLLGRINIAIEVLAFGRHVSTSTSGIGEVTFWRRLCAPVIGAAMAGLAWGFLRRREVVTVRATLDAKQPRRLDPLVQLIDAFAQLIIVGSGSSLGREAAPRQLAAVSAQWVAEVCEADFPLRRTLIASATGAGLAAVYNVPFAGALYALELTLRPNPRTRQGWQQIAICTTVSLLATAMAWLTNHNAPTYTPDPVSTAGWGTWGRATLLGMAVLLVGPLAGMVFSHAKRVNPKAHHLYWTVPLGGAIVAGIALLVPQVPGNGQIMMGTLLGTRLTWQLAATFLVAKLLATSVSLTSGAAGGLLTPSLAIGGSTGALLGVLTGATSGETVALVIAGAAGVLAMTQRAPLFAIAFALELTRPKSIVIPLVAVTVGIAWAGWALITSQDHRHGAVGKAPRR